MYSIYYCCDDVDVHRYRKKPCAPLHLAMETCQSVAHICTSFLYGSIVCRRWKKGDYCLPPTRDEIVISMFSTTDEQTITCKEGGNFFSSMYSQSLHCTSRCRRSKSEASYCGLSTGCGCSWVERILFTVKCVNVKRKEKIKKKISLSLICYSSR